MNPLIWTALIQAAFAIFNECKEEEKVADEELVIRIKNAGPLQKIRLVRRADLTRKERKEALAHLMSTEFDEEAATELVGMYREEYPGNPETVDI